jgi:hypothetical protein
LLSIQSDLKEKGRIWKTRRRTRLQESHQQKKKKWKSSVRPSCFKFRQIHFFFVPPLPRILFLAWHARDARKSPLRIMSTSTVTTFFFGSALLFPVELGIELLLHLRLQPKTIKQRIVKAQEARGKDKKKKRARQTALPWPHETHVHHEHGAYA